MLLIGGPGKIVPGETGACFGKCILLVGEVRDCGEVSGDAGCMLIAVLVMNRSGMIYLVKVRVAASEFWL
jgi:hypothetical protein